MITYIISPTVSCGSGAQLFHHFCRFSFGPLRDRNEPIPKGCIVLILLEGGHIEAAEKLIAFSGLIPVMHNLQTKVSVALLIMAPSKPYFLLCACCQAFVSTSSEAFEASSIHLPPHPSLL